MNIGNAKRLALYIAGNLSSHFCHLPPTLYWREGLMFRRSDEESEREKKTQGYVGTCVCVCVYVFCVCGSVGRSHHIEGDRNAKKVY